MLLISIGSYIDESHLSDAQAFKDLLEFNDVDTGNTANLKSLNIYILNNQSSHNYYKSSRKLSY